MTAEIGIPPVRRASTSFGTSFHCSFPFSVLSQRYSLPRYIAMSGWPKDDHPLVLAYVELEEGPG